MIIATASPHNARCVHIGTFDISHTAAALSQLAGVLAGFAFFAVIFVLTVDGGSPVSKARRIRLDSALFILFCATFALAIAAIQYAMLAGETGYGLWHGRASSEEVLADVSLGLSIMVLITALLFLMPQFKRSDGVLRALTAILGPTMAVYYVAETCSEAAVGIWAARLHRLTFCRPPLFPQVEKLGHVTLPLGLLVLMSGIFILGRVPSVARRVAQLAGHLRGVVPVVALGAVVAAATAGVSLDVFHTAAHLTEGEMLVVLGATGAVAVLQAFQILFDRSNDEGGPTNQPDATGQHNGVLHRTRTNVVVTLDGWPPR